MTICCTQYVSAQGGFGSLTPVQSGGTTTTTTAAASTTVITTQPPTVRVTTQAPTQPVTTTIIPTTVLPTGINNTNIDCEIIFDYGIFTSNYTCTFINSTYFNTSYINSTTHSPYNNTQTLINGTFTYSNGSQHYVTYYNITNGVIYIPVTNYTFITNTSNATITDIENALYNTSLYTANVSRIVNTTIFNNNTIINETGISNYSIGSNNTIIPPTPLPTTAVPIQQNTANECVVYFKNGEFVSNQTCSGLKPNHTVPYNSTSSLINGTFYLNNNKSQSGVAAVYNTSNLVLSYTNGSMQDTGKLLNVQSTSNSTLTNNSTNTTTQFTIVNETGVIPTTSIPTTAIPVTHVNATECVIYFSTGEFVGNSSCATSNNTSSSTSLVLGHYYSNNDQSNGISAVYNQSNAVLSYTNGTLLASGVVYGTTQVTNSTLVNNTNSTAETNITTTYNIVNETGVIPTTPIPTTPIPVTHVNATECIVYFSNGEFVSNHSCSDLKPNQTLPYNSNTSLLLGTFYENNDLSKSGASAIYNVSNNKLTYTNGSLIDYGIVNSISTSKNYSTTTLDSIIRNITTTYTFINETGVIPTTIIPTTNAPISQVTAATCVIYFASGKFIGNSSCADTQVNNTAPYNASTSLVSGQYYSGTDQTSIVPAVYNQSSTNLSYTNGTVLAFGIVYDVTQVTNSTLSNTTNSVTNVTVTYNIINETGTKQFTTIPTTTVPVSQATASSCVVYFATGKFIGNQSCTQVNSTSSYNSSSSLVSGQYYLNDGSSNGISTVYNQSNAELSYTNGTVLTSGTIYTITQVINSTLSNLTNSTVNITTTYNIINETGVKQLISTSPPVSQLTASECVVYFASGGFIGNSSCSQVNSTSPYNSTVSLISGQFYTSSDRSNGVSAIYNQSNTQLSYTNGTLLASGTLNNLITYIT